MNRMLLKNSSREKNIFLSNYSFKHPSIYIDLFFNTSINLF